MDTQTQQLDGAETLYNIWLNVYWARDYLAQYEAIAENALELNKFNGHFWGITQKSALDSVGNTPKNKGIKK